MTVDPKTNELYVAVTIDSKQNIYVTESLTGQRAQRFLYKGLRAPTAN